MEDEFELVTKSELRQLRENHSKVQEELAKPKIDEQKQEKQPVQSNKELLKQFREIIQEENKIEKEQLINDLTHIKDLNKTTLSSVLERTDKLDTRIETLVSAISELVKTVHELVEEQNNNKPNTEHTEIISEIQNLSKNSNDNEHNLIIAKKLQEIEEFMSNLKILLSQIKPTDMNLS